MWTVNLDLFVGPYAMNDALEALASQGWRISSRRDGRARLHRRWRAIRLTFTAPGRVEQRPALSNWTLAAAVAGLTVAAALCYALAT